ncbi:unnamed protein product, partial [Brassica oleracea]
SITYVNNFQRCSDFQLSQKRTFCRVYQFSGGDKGVSNSTSIQWWCSDLLSSSSSNKVLVPSWMAMGLLDR